MRKDFYYDFYIAQNAGIQEDKKRGSELVRVTAISDFISPSPQNESLLLVALSKQLAVTHISDQTTRRKPRSEIIIGRRGQRIVIFHDRRLDVRKMKKKINKNSDNNSNIKISHNKTTILFNMSRRDIFLSPHLISYSLSSGVSNQFLFRF